MGMSLTVSFEGRPPPAWPGVQACLAERSFPVQMRLIDGELAAPDEVPPADWHELRVGTPLGMVAVRRGPDWVELVTWSSADALMIKAWNGLAWAFAEVGAGRIAMEQGQLNAYDFAKQVELPDGIP